MPKNIKTGERVWVDVFDWRDKKLVAVPGVVVETWVAMSMYRYSVQIYKVRFYTMDLGGTLYANRVLDGMYCEIIFGHNRVFRKPHAKGTTKCLPNRSCN